MALFKFRKNGEAAPASLTSAPAESLEAIRKKATYRLIGAVVLVVAAVIGFPLLLDSQPRPVPVDVRIDIPDKGKVKPLAVPPPAQTESPASAAAPVPAVPVATPAPLPATAPAPAPAPPPEPKAKPAPVADKPAAENAPTKDDGARAQALLEGKAKDTGEPKDAAPGGKFVVQVGAYADPDKAREARSKLERAGLKTYTQVAKTKDGDRIRVRVGPFADRAQAEQTATKVKALSLDAAILTL